jgi:hypothetical protein
VNNGFIWLHGNYAPDVNNTWAALVGPGVKSEGVNHETWADHADLRPTLMTLLCLKDNYTHAGRAVIEDLDSSVLPDSARDARDVLVNLGRTFKRINAPVGAFGRDAISVSTTAIKGDAATYSSLEDQLQNLVTRRDELANSIEAQLDRVPGCSGFAADDASGNLERLNARGREILQDMRRLAGQPDDSGD